MESKQKENYLLRFGVTILGLLAAGIVSLWWSELLQNESIGKKVLENIGTAFFFSGVLAVAQEFILKEKLVDLILSKLKLKEDIDRTGIENIYFGIKEIDYGYLFKRAKKNIDIIHVYGRTWTNNNIDEIDEKLLNSTCKIRVVLLSPDSPFVPALADLYGQSPDELKQTIEQVAKIWKKSWENNEKRRKRKKNKSTLELFFHNGFPANSLYRIDDKVVFVQTKMTKGKTTRLPSFICKDTKNADLYTNYTDEINALIDEAKKVDWSNI